MARRVFFSFHYQRDVNRAMVVRNSWVTKADRDDAGFFDSSVFESKQRTSPDALKRFLNDGLSGCSVACVLAGSQTAWRRWVRYELLRSFADGRGIFGIAVHGIRDMRTGLADGAGQNPLACLGFEVKGLTLHFKEWDGAAAAWRWAADLPSMPLAGVSYNLGGRTNATFADLFPFYSWGQGGYDALGTWVESAARSAGR